jgi:hypothetical protein
MKGLFETFCETIEELPVQAILKASELECKMLENDLACQRLSANEELLSVLTFCRFLKASPVGKRFLKATLPLRDTARYRQIVERLVQAEELPHEAKEQFDRNFSLNRVKNLTAN